MSTPHVARTERLALCDALLAAGPDAPTLCEGWAARDLAAHIVVREARPDLAVGLLVPALAGRLEQGQADLAAEDFTRLVERIRTGPPWWNPARLSQIDDVVNVVEFAVHTEDVLRGDGAVGPRREVPARTQRALWSALTRGARLMFRSSTVGVRLAAPGFGDLVARGGEPTVTFTGAPLELLLAAYGRMAAAKLELTGDPAAIDSLRATRLGFG